MMVSYVNQEDWNLRYENDGEYYNIDQEFVDDLYFQVKNLKEYKKLRKYKATSPIKTHIPNKCITLDEAKEHFVNSFKLGDGARHKALFVIKNRLTSEDRDLFTDWLISNYPKYLQNWNSHKLVGFCPK